MNSSENYNIVLEKELPEVDILVAGFPGLGLIGGIASEQIINSLGLEQVASINSDQFPPTAVIFEGIPRRPVRIFGGENFLLVKADMIIPNELANSLSRWIVDWAKDIGIKEIVIFDGIVGAEDNEKRVWGVLSAHSAEREAKKFDVDVINRGSISGMSSSLLLEAHDNKLKAIALLAEGTPEIPDARASANLLNKFSDYIDVQIETESLIESAEQFEKGFSKLVDQTQRSHESMEQHHAHPPLYG